MAVVPRLTPAEREPLKLPSKAPASGFGYSPDLPLRLRSEGCAHCTCPDAWFRPLPLGLQACIGSETLKRPSTPITQVGLVLLRIWFISPASMPTARYSIPLRVGDLNGRLKSCSPGAPASVTDCCPSLPAIPESWRSSERMIGTRNTSAMSLYRPMSARVKSRLVVCVY